MRLLKGSITIEDINNMSRRDLIYRLESRMRALQKESKKEAMARKANEAIEDHM